jgi:hypothetical protein
MRQLSCFWLVLTFFWVGCAPTPAAVPVSQPVQSASTAVVPTVQPVLTTQPLTAAQTAVPTPTLQPTLDAPPPTSVIAQITPEPTATFAAYGVAQTIGTSAGGRPIESYPLWFWPRCGGNGRRYTWRLRMEHHPARLRDDRLLPGQSRPDSRQRVALHHSLGQSRWAVFCNGGRRPFHPPGCRRRYRARPLQRQPG